MLTEVSMETTFRVAPKGLLCLSLYITIHRHTASPRLQGRATYSVDAVLIRIGAWQALLVACYKNNTPTQRLSPGSAGVDERRVSCHYNQYWPCLPNDTGTLSHELH